MWRCNNCNKTEGVTNGFCPKDGPTQTTPIDNDAKEEAGIFFIEKQKVAEKEAAKRNAESIKAGKE